MVGRIKGTLIIPKGQIIKPSTQIKKSSSNAHGSADSKYLSDAILVPANPKGISSIPPKEATVKSKKARIFRCLKRSKKGKQVVNKQHLLNKQIPKLTSSILICPNTEFGDIKLVSQKKPGIACSNTLGTGGQANVKGYSVDSDLLIEAGIKETAVKKYYLKPLGSNPDPAFEMGARETAEREIKILNHLGTHPNIVRLLGFMEVEGSAGIYDKDWKKTGKDPNVGKICLVLERCRGDVYQLLKDMFEYKPYTLDHVLKYLFLTRESLFSKGMSEICCAVAFCHAKNIIIRDIKSENLLITDDGEFKLTDFGLSVFSEEEDRLKTASGTSATMAPEVAHAITPDIGRFISEYFNLLLRGLKTNIHNLYAQIKDINPEIGGQLNNLYANLAQSAAKAIQNDPEYRDQQETAQRFLKDMWENLKRGNCPFLTSFEELMRYIQFINSLNTASGTAQDVWSLGCVLMETLKGYMPYEVPYLDDPFNSPITPERLPRQANSQEFLKRNILFCNNWFGCEEPKDKTSLDHLLYRMLDPNQATRYTMEAVLKHPWIKEQENTVRLSNIFSLLTSFDEDRLLEFFTDERPRSDSSLDIARESEIDRTGRSVNDLGVCSSSTADNSDKDDEVVVGSPTDSTTVHSSGLKRSGRISLTAI
ncbi:protein kinase [Thermoproteota archaeon]